MKNKESRRIVPASVFALIMVGLLVLAQLLIVAGALEVRGSAVARIAPWAYEPFLRLVGEHPDNPRYSVKEEPGKTPAPDASGLEFVSGFEPVSPDATNAVPAAGEEPVTEIPPIEPAPETPRKPVPVG